MPKHNQITLPKAGKLPSVQLDYLIADGDDGPSFLAVSQPDDHSMVLVTGTEQVKLFLTAVALLVLQDVSDVEAFADALIEQINTRGEK